MKSEDIMKKFNCIIRKISSAFGYKKTLIENLKMTKCSDLDIDLDYELVRDTEQQEEVLFVVMP